MELLLVVFLLEHALALLVGALSLGTSEVGDKGGGIKDRSEDEYHVNELHSSASENDTERSRKSEYQGKIYSYHRILWTERTAKEDNKSRKSISKRPESRSP